MINITAARGVAWKTCIALTDQANLKVFKVAPTIETGDFQISKDGADYASLTHLPLVLPVGSSTISLSLSAAEMNADLISVLCSDQAGDEWCDVLIVIATEIKTVATMPVTVSPQVVYAGQPVDGARVWVSTDSAGQQVVTFGVTDSFGNVNFYLDAGTYYLWKRYNTYLFDNPETLVVA